MGCSIRAQGSSKSTEIKNSINPGHPPSAVSDPAFHEPAITNHSLLLSNCSLRRSGCYPYARGQSIVKVDTTIERMEQVEYEEEMYGSRRGEMDQD
jgi:hypothetical protein